MGLKETRTYNLGSSVKTEPIALDGGGPISIQPVIINTICNGTPTWTLQVSNIDEDNSFIDFDPLSTDISFEDFLELDFNPFPWCYIRFSINTVPNTSGACKFLIKTY